MQSELSAGNSKKKIYIYFLERFKFSFSKNLKIALEQFNFVADPSYEIMHWGGNWELLFCGYRDQCLIFIFS